MSKIIDHFKTIVTIPRCSSNASKLKDFLVEFGEQHGYKVQVDKLENILITKGTPKLCLQAHYDMVCMGKAPNIEVYEENGWLKALDSSLGADNGMAIAMMMVLMEEGLELEFLFTSDEEIGLIGAGGVEFVLNSKHMLNLDSEEEGEVCIGCAGGVDIKAIKKLTKNTNQSDCYEVSLSGLVGGHSGVDIDKNIPNAITELSKFLQENKAKIVDFSGGERINSIPANAKAIIASNIEIHSREQIIATKITKSKFVYSDDIATLIADFSNGVLEYNDELKLPNISQNLAIVSIKNDILTIDVSIRAMSMADLDKTSKETAEYFRNHGFDVDKRDKYPAWKPEINDFTKLVDETMREVIGKSKLGAIHAGLECGVLKQRYPDMLFASIGPTILYPHSTREMVDIESVDRVFEVLKDVIGKIYLL